MADDIDLAELLADDEDADDEDAADREDAVADTSFSYFQPIDAPEQVGESIPLLQRDLLQSSIDDYYAALVKHEGEPQLGRDPLNFELVNGELRLKAYPNVRIVNARTGTPLALKTIYTRSGGPDIIRGGSGLGFVDWQYTAVRRRLPSPIQSQLKNVADEANAAATTDDAALEGAVDRFISGVDNMPKVFSTEAQTTETLPPDLLPLREIQGLSDSLKTLRGMKAVQESKKVSLQQLIKGYRKNLKQPGTTERADQIEREIQKAADDLIATKDSINALNQETRSQVSQIRDSILHVLDKNTTLAERVRTLFREQGVTIVSILTAIGLAISTLVLALTGGGAAVAPVIPTPTPPADKAGLKEWAKKHLQALGSMLAQLAGKAAAALPGIIGSIISWLLNLLSKTAGWLAENLWALVVAIGGLLLVFAREWLLP